MVAIERRVALAVFILLVMWAALAWTLTARASAQMSGMALGVAQIGTHMPSAMSAPVFMGMWLTMMVAMMFPAMGPMVLAHRMVTRRRTEGWTSTLTFIAGYLVVWTGVGAVPFVALVLFGKLSFDGGASRWLPVLAGTILCAAGAYQFTPLKSVCLRACRTPVGFILSHDFRSGAAGSFRIGVVHGVFCLGCCWALMAILMVMGLMNLAWMAALSAIFLLEKNWRRGIALSRVIGFSLILLGAAVIARPEFLITLAGGRGATPSGQSMPMDRYEH